MAVKPIIFSAPMVKALLAGTKTQTRRILKPQPDTSKISKPFHPEPRGNRGLWVWMACDDRPGYAYATQDFNVRFAKGDVLYVREAWRTEARFDKTKAGDLPDGALISFEADYDYEPNDGCRGKLRPPIFHRQRDSRLTLAVSDVRVQRLNDCSEADAVAEGVVRLNEHEWHVPGVEHSNRDFPRLSRSSPVEMYAALWDTINGSGAWLANPWVCAISFTVYRQNVDAYLKATANAR